MYFKSAKLRSFGKKNVKIPDNFRLLISGKTINRDTREKPGKNFNNSLKDTSAIRGTIAEIHLRLSKVDKSTTSKPFKGMGLSARCAQ